MTNQDWEEYAAACLTHDIQEPIVAHAAELASAGCD